MTEDLDFSTDRTDHPSEQSDETRRQLAELRENVDFLIHEIRTPLTAIISSVGIVMERPLSPQEHGSLLNIIHQEASRINELLCNFDRSHHQQAESWLSDMTFSTLRVADLLHDTAIRFHSASPLHPIRVSLAQELTPVRGDRMKLELVLRNLVANAIKYSPGGGTVSLSAENCPEGVIICVRDQGIGIPAEDLNKIFDRNFRIDRPGSRKTRGSGQGLAIVARIIKGHGGTLQVESEVGKGSAFFFTLPTLS